MTNANIGYLIHGASDCSVPVSHAPANQVYTNTTREAWFEAGVTAKYSPPALSSLLTGTYAQKVSAFYSNEMAQVNDYKKSNSIWNLKYYDLQPWATPCMLYGEQLSQAALLNYFQAHMPGMMIASGGVSAVPEPSTLAMLASLAMASGVVLLRRRRQR